MNTNAWRRGRIVFDHARDLFVLYADRKLMPRKIIARIQAEFHLPANRTEVKGDIHYQSRETPRGLPNPLHYLPLDRL